MFGKALLACSVSAIALTCGAYAQAEQQTETVVVTGIRATIAQALDVKRESTQVVESVIAEDIGKLPDNNVVEALQRLTGVQVTNRGGGQVGAISIRGLGDIETTWNGRKLFTASGLYYSVQDMPATLVRRLDVYKTRESNQIETGIAGQIDVSSYRPFDFDGFKITGQARATYEEKRGATDPNIGLLISNRWHTSIGEIGALANVSWSVVRFRDQGSGPGALVPFATEAGAPGTNKVGDGCMGNYTALERIFNTSCREPDLSTPQVSEYIPPPVDAWTDLATIWQAGTDQGLSEKAGSTISVNGQSIPYYLSRDAIFQNDFTGKRTRPNANFAFQWSPNDHSTYTLEVMYNGYRQETYNNLLFSFVDWWGDFAGATPAIAPASSFTLYPGTNVMKTRHVGNVYGFNSGDWTSSKTNSYVYALNAKWDLSDRFKASADFSYQASQYATQFTAMRIDRGAPEIFVDFSGGGDIMSFNFGSTQNRLTDPSYWNTAQLYDNANHTKGAAYTLQFDGTYDMKGLLGPLTQVRFGGRFDRRSADEAFRQASDWHGQQASTLDSAAFHYVNDFFDGVGDVPHSWVNIDGRWVYENIAKLRTQWGGDLVNVRDHVMLENFRTTEDTISVYAEGNFEQDVFSRPLSLNVGIRYVDATNTYSFVNRNKFLSDGTLVTSGGSNYAGRWLPSATLSYEPVDDVKLRLNYGETLRRPNFGDLNPNQILNADVTKIGRGTGSQGNPNLKPTHAKNIDISAEWYFAPSSAIYGTLFRRDIDNQILSLNLATVIPGADILAKYNTNTFVIGTPVNASKGNLKGIELGFVYFPDFLPSYLDGLGAQGSLTVLSSSQNIPLTNDAGLIIGQAQQSMWGVSPMSYNGTLIYEKGDFGARVSYVWRAKFLSTNEARLFANPIGIWRHAESSLDVQTNYKAWDGVMLTFDVVNLLNAKQKQYYKFGDQGGPGVTNFGTAVFSRTFSVGLRYSTN